MTDPKTRVLRGPNAHSVKLTLNAEYLEPIWTCHEHGLVARRWSLLAPSSLQTLKCGLDSLVAVEIEPLVLKQRRSASERRWKMLSGVWTIWTLLSRRDGYRRLSMPETKTRANWPQSTVAVEQELKALEDVVKALGPIKPGGRSRIAKAALQLLGDKE